MMALLGLMAVPLVVLGGAFLLRRGTITWKEFLLGEGIALPLVVAGFYIAKWGALQDTEHLNGRISTKNHGTQSCCHCHEECDTCSDGKGGTTSCNCHEVCQHSIDYWWSISLTTGHDISIKDCSGSSATPEAWTVAQVGEPASVEHLYTNYLLADKNSLWLQVGDPELMAKVPRFPQVHDFYRVARVVQVGGALIPDEWDTLLQEVNADLGASRQVDVTLVVTSEPGIEFADAVEAKWLYGPKNAVIIVAGVRGTAFSWVRVISISNVEQLKVDLREALVGKSVLDAKTGVATIRGLVDREFTRTPMAEWKYLVANAHPSTGWLIFLYILATALSVGLAIWADRVDIFGDENRFRPSRWTGRNLDRELSGALGRRVGRRFYD